MSSENTSQPSSSNIGLQVDSSSIKTNENLHILVRSYCLQHRIPLGKLSGDYRHGVELSLKDLLKVNCLTTEHNRIVKNFCDQAQYIHENSKLLNS